MAMLATARVRLRAAGRVSPAVRALCDTGAQANLIDSRIVTQMQWTTRRCDVRISGINGSTAQPLARRVTCDLLSRFNDEVLAVIELAVSSKMPSLMLPESLIPDHNIPASIREELADPEACKPLPFNVVLGAGVWAAVVRDGILTNKTGLTFQPSTLGWLAFGGDVQSRDNAVMALTLKEETEPHLDVLLRRFWETEEVPTIRTRTLEQEDCERVFLQSHQRLPSGRYQVDIPLIENLSQLGSSRAVALHRYHQLERRLNRDPELKQNYTAAMNELLEAGHMKLVDHPPTGRSYYIPHHAVLKKFRIVYDASCPTDLGKSLNDVQLVGEKLQDDLADLIMRFRCHAVAITADVRKMFLQVLVNPEQWDLQRIFWRPAPDDKIKEYWLTTVTFGMASAPHCAVRAMIQAARDMNGTYPMGATAVERDFYIDDCLTGADNNVEAKNLCTEIDGLLRSCGFILGKWRSNRTGVVPAESATLSEEALDLNEFSDTTVLGLRWLPRTDELMFKYQHPQSLSSNEATKRRVLSHIAQIYDPNGYIGPVVIVAKIIMQRIWSAQIGWDEVVPSDIYRDWQQFQLQLTVISELRLPRWLGITRNAVFSLHGFADASTVAYGAVLYVRVEHSSSIKTIIVAAKSHVAPLKTITVPRLELCAAQLLSELVGAFKSAARLPDVDTTLWSDSKIVLAWLKKDASTLKIYVNNRVQRIQQLTRTATWRHVPTESNPADLLSRGTTVGNLQSSTLWWNGPEWLPREALYWPETELNLSRDEKADAVKEEKADVAEYRSDARQKFKDRSVMSIMLNNSDLLSRASTAASLFRKTAWILRFIQNTRTKSDQSHLRILDRGLRNEELVRAQVFWLKEEQRVYYSRELKELTGKSSRGVEKASPIARFNPFLDQEGVLRVGGRLENALIPACQKNPALLPDVSHLSTLLIREAHERTLHGGPQLVMAFVRQRFWITNLRRAVKTNISRCVVCVRQRSNVEQQLMAELPSDRVRPCRAFRRAGVDYAGPFMVRPRAGRGNILEKKYVAVFVCMATRAVHLELVESLSSEDFIQAFFNFTGIRGPCERIWSDNGRNFVGAEKELKRMILSWRGLDIENKLPGTEWRFITPSAPHQGGLWEAAVKSMKHHM